MTTKTIHINNMICTCCIKVIKMELNNMLVTVNKITFGKADISYDKDKVSFSEIENGFSLLIDTI